jgi:TIR domain
MNEVFISYAWGGESEAIADSLEQTLSAQGIKLIRDKTELGYKSLIREFMQQIGRGKCVIAVISDKYLKSKNCMFELLEISKNGDFYDRIFPIVLKDARIYNAIERLNYIKYWEDKIKELDEGMRGVSLANLQGFREEIDLYTEIRNKIAGLVDILQNMNTLSPEMHREADFKEVIAAIGQRLSKDTEEMRQENYGGQNFQTKVEGGTVYIGTNYIDQTPKPIETAAKNPDALKLWREKLAYLQSQEAIASNPAVKFELNQQIEECKRKIEELES